MVRDARRRRLVRERQGPIRPTRGRALPGHLVRRDLRVFLDSALQARQLYPARACAAGDRCGLRARAGVRRRRPLAVMAIANLALAAVPLVFFELVPAPINPAIGFDGLLIGAVAAAGGIAMYSLGRAAARVPYAIVAMALAMLATVPLASHMREDASSISTYRNLANAVRPYLAPDCTLA